MPSTEPISVEVLGPVRMRAGTAEVAVGSPRRQAVLGFLAINARSVVSRDQLVDAVWGEAPPKSAAGNVHTYISDLRRSIAEATGHATAAAVLQTAGAGYRLDVRDADLDFRQVEHDLRTASNLASSGERTDAITTWQRALRRSLATPFAGIDAPYALAERHRLENLVLAAVIDLVRALLARGTETDTRTALITLERALSRHPLHQRLAEMRIRALSGRGRRAEAIDQYETTRRLLATELGVDPDQGLRQAHEEIVRDTVSTVHGRNGAVPELPLPAAPDSLVGRADELGFLEDALTRAGGSRILTIDGSPGIGKTALALRFAHDVAARFPDGCHFLDLRGSRPSAGPLPATAALDRLITAVGGRDTTVPNGFEDRLGVYRTVLARKRLLLVLDDASRASQIRPLLPGGDGTTVLVTSRRRLSGLVATEGAVRLPLDVLPHDAARSLLAGAADERGTGALDELVRLCGHLPLALAHVARYLAAGTGRGPAELATWLSDEHTRIARLTELGGDQGIRPVFASAVHALNADEQKVFSLLGKESGADVDVTGTARRTGWPEPRARHCLDQLAVAGLLDWGTWDRYHLTPLLHLYARGLPTPR
ncbi:AfsR/SARP family transcriptional regulator [Amycolatopsis sp. CA-230715]|uniref:AfsR/SARP family transcriptional regulator n=1 Tax=Amycolatopsis sp. CA-230715 TaxID=2745196 RepID=UPI001C01CD57|nr:BTAD domain-containing putative transcriptional regulator [Amycolatopsis sp. CA-230715]